MLPVQKLGHVVLRSPVAYLHEHAHEMFESTCHFRILSSILWYLGDLVCEEIWFPRLIFLYWSLANFCRSLLAFPFSLSRCLRLERLFRSLGSKSVWLLYMCCECSSWCRFSTTIQSTMYAITRSKNKMKFFEFLALVSLHWAFSSLQLYLSPCNICPVYPGSIYLH